MRSEPFSSHEAALLLNTVGTRQGNQDAAVGSLIPGHQSAGRAPTIHSCLAALLSMENGLTIARTARKLGMDSQPLYRFRKRLLPKSLRSAPEPFETILLAFVDRCGTNIPLKLPDSILER